LEGNFTGRYIPGTGPSTSGFKMLVQEHIQTGKLTVTLNNVQCNSELHHILFCIVMI